MDNVGMQEDLEPKLNRFTVKLMDLKEQKKAAESELVDINKEITSLEGQIISNLEANDRTSFTNSTSTFTIKQKVYVTIPKTNIDKVLLHQFLTKHGEGDSIKVSSSDLNKLYKKFYKENKDSDPLWTLPGCEMAGTPYLSITKAK